MGLHEEMKALAEKAKAASPLLAAASASRKNDALKAIAESLKENEAEIIKANKKDVGAAKKNNKAGAFIDRLTLDHGRISGMAEGLGHMIRLDDPVGIVLERRKLRSGILLEKLAVPIGVVLMIFEARPNIVIDAGALCLKSGNAAILKGGSDAMETNKALIRIVRKGLEQAGLPQDAAVLVESADHAAISSLLRMDEQIDLVIPRGGEGLIRSVVEKSTIPVIKHYKGLCHTYVDKDADLEMASAICVNAKTQRPGVCNAMETLLVHHDIAEDFLKKAGPVLKEKGVEIKGCQETCRILGWAKAATEDDYRTEWLDLKMAVKIVRDIDEAIEHIATHGSGHSEAIITENRASAERFLKKVDASAVFHNASTRFNDGFEFGLGAEIGISTQKIHARGPMGLRELTSYKYVLKGSGQVRE